MSAGALAVTLIAVTSASGSSAPGISSTQVTLGAVVTQSGFAEADFNAYLYGVDAYLYYVNHSLHGVNGRTLNLQYPLDDQSDPTTNESDLHTLVTSDHVFAVVGVSTAFFEPGPGSGTNSFLAKSGTPIFGYATENNWGGPKNFFADYGSLIDYASSVPEFAYVADETKATRVAVIAYNYPSSQDECAPAVAELKKDYKVNIVYSNLNEPIINANFTTDVTKMVNDKVNMVISCMQASDDVTLTKELGEYGISNIPQVWLDGYDRSTLAADAKYMNNVYLMLQHVPFEAYTAFPRVFPGLGLYFTEMSAFLHAQFGSSYSSYAKYEYDDVSLMGWESANLFTEGLRAAGKDPTQAAVVADINKITNDFGGPTGDGVTAPTSWKLAHTEITPPSCVTFVTTQGTSDPATATFKLAFMKGSDPWICFPTKGIANIKDPVKPPAGTPGG
jgi:branched-chain amino acid transport system substrate-binding protein